MSATTLPVPPWRASYRLQLRDGVDFERARALVPYLAALGVSHLYLSPFMRARAGSTHGYDVVDHERLDPVLGSEEDFDALVAELARHGMGVLADWVPNHVGVGPDNARWQSVLELGPDSPDADFFDIDWEAGRPALAGKLLLPVLGAPYGEVLERGELEVVFEVQTGAFAIRYHEHRFAVAPATAAALIGAAAARMPDGSDRDALSPLASELRALGRGRVARDRRARVSARLAELRAELARRAAASDELRAALAGAAAALAGEPGKPSSFDPLHRLLEAQHHRLAYWRMAADEINYRRFFDVDDLAALRMERPEVFEATHRWLIDALERGRVHGVRIDHVDGLADPAGYCVRLRERMPPGRVLLLEKILEEGEGLREWPVDGTTGYEVANEINGLFVDPAGRGALERLHRRITGERRDFDELVIDSKHHVMRAILASELEGLAGALERLAEGNRHTRDFTRASLRRALRHVVAGFPVYRSYVDDAGASDEDRAVIGRGLDHARAQASEVDGAMLDWLERVLTAEWVPRAAPSARRRAQARFVRRFQQYTAPVMAKGLEDTALYRQHLLLSLNEVGGDPRRFGVDVEDFHRASAERARRWPRALVAGSTHDTKRGEDARARIDVLSEIPDRFGREVLGWMRLNRPHRGRRGGRVVPHPKDEYLIYQALLGSWPTHGRPAEELAPRLRVYLEKALREGKERTSWRHVDADYESGVLAFVERILSPGSAFLERFAPFAGEVARAGAAAALAQLVLRTTVPGVPDLYQGAELWELSMADPDNRRPVDFELRRRWLTEVDRLDPAVPGALESLVERWPDGRIKLFLTRRLLALRARLPELFEGGTYRPLAVDGPAARHVVAFARETADGPPIVTVVGRLLAAAPRSAAALFPEASFWEGTTVHAPPAHGWRDALTDATLPGTAELAAPLVFARWPFAVLAAAEAPR